MPTGAQATMMVYKKNCIICGKEFEAERKNVKCCSGECKRKRSTEIKNAWKAIHQTRKSTLDQTIRELNEYNRVHGTHLTYGKYKAMKFMEARG